MSDDTLRMRAVVEDGYTAPLADLRKQLRGIGTNSTARAVEKDWKAVGKNVGGVANELRVGVAGGLRAIGMTSIAAGVGVTSIGAALAGIVVGVKKFSGTIRDLRLFSGQVGMSVQHLRELKVLGERFGVPWEAAQGSLKTFSDNLNDLRRHWGAAYNELRGMNLGDLAEDIAKAPDMKAAFERALDGIKKIQNPVLRRQVAQLLLGTDQWAVVAAETTTETRKAIADKLKPLSKETIESADSLANDLADLNLKMENLKTQGLSPLLKLYGDFSSGKLAPSLKNVRTSRLEQDEKDLEAVRGMIESARKRGETVSPHLLRKQDDLVKEIEKLRKALEQTNRDGALMQKSSFNGFGFGGAGVIQASWAGGGGGGGGGRNGVGMRPPAVDVPPMGNAGGGMRPSGSAARGGIGMRPPAGGDSGSGSVGSGGSSAASGAGSSAFLRNRRQRYANEIANTPGLRERIGGMLALEGTAQPTMESLLNRIDYVNGERAKRGLPPKSIDDMLTPAFYGPIRDGKLPGGIAQYRRNRGKFDRAIDRALGGSHVIGGYTDQGMSTDPNGSVTQWRRHGRRYPFKKVGGNEFPDWEGGPGGRRTAAAYRFMVEEELAKEAKAQGIESAHAVQHGYHNPTIDLLETARRNAAASMTHRVEGNASLRIDLNGLPEGSRVRSNADGMFQKVQINRGRPMQSVWDPS